MSQLITSLPQFEQYLHHRGHSLESCGLSFLRDAYSEYPLRLSSYYADLIDWNNPADPLRAIAIPTAQEDFTAPYELLDPIGDHAREAVPGLIHRYPDRALLLLTTHCRIHCRFCFRREVVGRGRPFNLPQILSYLQSHPEIHEVIFSGGDPFTFPTVFLQKIIDQLITISHLKRIRFHTRIPAVDPDSIPQDFFDALAAIPCQVIVVIHTDHPREVTIQYGEVVQKLRNANCLLLSQTVLLRGINNSPQTLTQLFEALVDCGVKPYYLHHPDKVVHTDHFRISIEEGKKIFAALRGNVSSVCVPEYVLDIPEGYGKIPVMWLEKIEDRKYLATTFEGKQITYDDPKKEHFS